MAPLLEQKYNKRPFRPLKSVAGRAKNARPKAGRYNNPLTHKENEDMPVHKRLLEKSFDLLEEECEDFPEALVSNEYYYLFSNNCCGATHMNGGDMFDKAKVAFETLSNITGKSEALKSLTIYLDACSKEM